VSLLVLPRLRPKLTVPSDRYGGECWGANEITTGKKQDESKCSMTCNDGTKNVICGSSALSLVMLCPL